jgi:hypothetical protein
MNHQDKQLTSFLGMTIGSALDDYMASLAKQIAKANKQEETSKRNIQDLETVLATYQRRLPIAEQKVAAVENTLWLAQLEKNKLGQQLKERDEKIADLEIELRQKDIVTAQIDKESKETKAKLASIEAKQTQVVTPNSPVIKHFMEWKKVGVRQGANTELQCAAILDNYKNLMWAMNTSKSDSFPHPAKWFSWQQAQEWVKQVNAKGWCGYHDWRLPTCDELSLILLLKAKDDFLLNNTNIQNSGAANTTYWTSTTKVIVGIQQPHVYVVNFKLAFSYTATPNNTYQVRLVRSV